MQQEITRCPIPPSCPDHPDTGSAASPEVRQLANLKAELRWDLTKWGMAIGREFFCCVLGRFALFLQLGAAVGGSWLQRPT